MIKFLALLVSLATPTGESPGDKFTHFAGYELGKATLVEVQDQYGKSRVRESGDAGEYEAWICYATPYGEVQFNSAEMGGGTDLIGFTLSQASTAKDCPKPKSELPTQIAGLALGTSKGKFIQSAGNPIEWAKNTGTTSFEYQTMSADGVPIDVSITVIATFRSSKLVKLVIWKIETT